MIKSGLSPGLAYGCIIIATNPLNRFKMRLNAISQYQINKGIFIHIFIIVINN